MNESQLALPDTLGIDNVLALQSLQAYGLYMLILCETVFPKRRIQPKSVRIRLFFLPEIQ